MGYIYIHNYIYIYIIVIIVLMGCSRIYWDIISIPPGKQNRIVFGVSVLGESSLILRDQPISLLIFLKMFRLTVYCFIFFHVSTMFHDFVKK